MELLTLITVMLASFGIALGIMKAALEFLLHSMMASTAAPMPRVQRRPARISLEQVAA